jgi:hypothetical protein
MTRIDMTLPAGAPPDLAQVARRIEGSRYHPQEVVEAALRAGRANDPAPASHALAEWLCPSWFWWH